MRIRAALARSPAGVSSWVWFISSAVPAGEVAPNKAGSGRHNAHQSGTLQWVFFPARRVVPACGPPPISSSSPASAAAPRGQVPATQYWSAALRLLPIMSVPAGAANIFGFVRDRPPLVFIGASHSAALHEGVVQRLRHVEHSAKRRWSTRKGSRRLWMQLAGRGHALGRTNPMDLTLIAEVATGILLAAIILGLIGWGGSYASRLSAAFPMVSGARSGGASLTQHFPCCSALAATIPSAHHPRPWRSTTICVPSR